MRLSHRYGADFPARDTVQQRVEAEAKAKAAQQRAATDLRIGKSMLQKGNTDSAKEYLQKVISRLPESDEAKEAQSILQQIEGAKPDAQ